MSEKSTRPWIRRSCLIIYVLVIFTSAFEMMGTFSDVHWAPADRVIADLRLDALARPSRVVYPTRRNVGSEFEVCAHDRAALDAKSLASLAIEFRLLMLQNTGTKYTLGRSLP